MREKLDFEGSARLSATGNGRSSSSNDGGGRRAGGREKGRKDASLPLGPSMGFQADVQPGQPWRDRWVGFRPWAWGWREVG
jgi:hypothetical protein